MTMEISKSTVQLLLSIESLTTESVFFKALQAGLLQLPGDLLVARC